MVDQASAMMITGPDVIKTVTGEDISIEDLGGAAAHNSRSGVAHFMSADEDEAIELLKALLSYLPSNNLDAPPVLDGPDALAEEPLTELDTSCPTAAARRTTCTSSSRRARRRRVPRGAGAVGAGRSCAASAASRAAASASSPTTRCTSPARSTSTPRRRPRASCAPATPSASRS
jgi:propionyl-CoA carboxylase beta chain